MSTSEEKPSGFKVTDRRSFSAEGEPRSEAADAPPASAPEASRAEGPAERQLPPVDFGTFVLSLGNAALLHLGDPEKPASGEPERDLPMAKHTIDILAMLQAKTKGNRTKAAEVLEISHRALLYKIKDYRIDR